MDEDAPASPTDVLVLGAGFSRAISDRAPLTDELGNLVIDRLKRLDLPTPAGGFSNGYFEAWLSRLAEDQPDLSESDNLQNRYWFSRVTEAMYSVLTDRENQILTGNPPAWLFKLLSVAHARRLSIITFNYDTLIEQAVRVHRLYDWSSRESVNDGDIVNDLPPPPRRGTFSRGEPAASFLLLKLHGSTNTWWVHDDVSGATVNRWGPFGAWGKPVEVDEARRRRELPGRSPFIVPPAASKSAYYRNPITREFWQSAAKSLSTASRVAILGFSLPATDLVASGMFGNHLTSHPVEISIADVDPDPIEKRLQRLGVANEQIRCHRDDFPIQEFVEELELRQAREFVSKLRNVLLELRHRVGEVPLLVWAGAGEFAVTEIRRCSDDEIELVTEAPEGPQGATRRREDPGSLVLTTDLRAALADGAEALIAVFPDTERRRLIDSGLFYTDTGASNTWMTLVPSGAPKSV